MFNLAYEPQVNLWESQALRPQAVKCYSGSVTDSEHTTLTLVVRATYLHILSLSHSGKRCGNNVSY